MIVCQAVKNPGTPVKMGFQNYLKRQNSAVLTTYTASAEMTKKIRTSNNIVKNRKSKFSPHSAGGGVEGGENPDFLRNRQLCVHSNICTRKKS